MRVSGLFIIFTGDFQILMVLKKYSTLFSYHCTDPNVGMSLNKDLGRFKIFLADTGLFVTLCFWDKVFTENTICQQLLGDKLKANLGYVYENLVAQMLASAGNQLFYLAATNLCLSKLSRQATRRTNHLTLSVRSSPHA